MTGSSRAVLMQHDKDPKQEILDAIAPYLKDVEVLGTSVIVANYVRPEKTKGGLLLPDGTIGMRAEDVYQGKVMLLVQCGKLAFEDSDDALWPVKPKVGDWIMMRSSDGMMFLLGATPCKVTQDINIRAILKQPDIAL